MPVPDSGPEPEPNPRVEATSELEQRPPATDTLLTELASVSSARRSLRSSKPAEALARIRRYQRESPAGQLADEAAAIEILALCQLGATRKPGSGEVPFLSTFPRRCSAPRSKSRARRRTGTSRRGARLAGPALSGRNTVAIAPDATRGEREGGVVEWAPLDLESAPHLAEAGL